MTWRRKWLLEWVLKNEWNFCRCRNKSISDKENSKNQSLQTKTSTEYPSLWKAMLFWDWSLAHGECGNAGEKTLARQCGLKVYYINLRVAIRAGLGGCAFWARTWPYSLDSPHPSGPTLLPQGFLNLGTSDLWTRECFVGGTVLCTGRCLVVSSAAK